MRLSINEIIFSMLLIREKFHRLINNVNEEFIQLFLLNFKVLIEVAWITIN